MAQICLIDFLAKDGNDEGGANNLMGMLSLKFQNQAKGFRKWNQKREDLLKAIEKGERDYEHSQRVGFQYIDPVYLDLPLEFIHDWELIERLVKYVPLSSYLPDEMKTKKFWKLLVSKRGSNLYYAPPEVKQDREIILAAVGSGDYEVFSIILELTNDREFMRECVQMDGNNIMFCGNDNMKQELLFEALNHGYKSELGKWDLNGEIADYGTEKYRNDRNVVLENVKRDGSFFRYASEELKGDKEIAIESMKTYRSSLSITSVELRQDSGFLNIAARFRQFNFLKYYFENRNYEKDYERDLDQICSSLSTNCSDYFYIHPDYKKDRNLHLRIIKIHSNFLERFPDEFKNDKEIVLEAVRNSIPNQMPFQSASMLLREDVEFIGKIIQISPSSLMVASNKIKNNRDIVMQIIQRNGSMLQFFPKFKRDKEMLIIALKQLSQSRLTQEEFDFLLREVKKNPEELLPCHSRDLLVITTKIANQLTILESVDTELEMIAAKYHGFIHKSAKKEHLHILFQERLDYEYSGFSLPPKYKTYLPGAGDSPNIPLQ